MGNILEVKNLTVSYGAIAALKGIDLVVPENSIVAILGANGAGKSTLLRTISGVVKAKSGEIILQGTNITREPVYRIAHRGVIQSPEGRMILNGLTVEENLKVGAYALKGREIIEADGTTKKLSKNQMLQRNFELVYRHFPILK